VDNERSSQSKLESEFLRLAQEMSSLGRAIVEIDANGVDANGVGRADMHRQFEETAAKLREVYASLKKAQRPGPSGTQVHGSSEDEVVWDEGLDGRWEIHSSMTESGVVLMIIDHFSGTVSVLDRELATRLNSSDDWSEIQSSVDETQKIFLRAIIAQWISDTALPVPSRTWPETREPDRE
jgi:hypothetical protein